MSPWSKYTLNDTFEYNKVALKKTKEKELLKNVDKGLKLQSHIVTSFKT